MYSPTNTNSGQQDETSMNDMSAQNRHTTAPQQDRGRTDSGQTGQKSDQDMKHADQNQH